MSLLRQVSPALRDPVIVGGLAAAYMSLAQVFRGQPSRFWPRMTRTGAILSMVALAAEPKLRIIHIEPRDVAIGVGSAGALYAVFQVGDRLVRWLMPTGAQQIATIYALRDLAPAPELAARLLMIGPAEELFWRGLVQQRLAETHGPWPGAVAATLLYSGAHLATGNLALIGAAGVAGMFWGGMYALGVPMSALLVSHATWDVLTFLVAPIEP